MMPEPITGLRLEENTLRINRMLEHQSLPNLQKALGLEALMQELYKAVSIKVMYVSADISDLLETFVQESSERKDELLRRNLGLNLKSA